jgi:hypothetical protein
MATERNAGLFQDIEGDDPPLDPDDLEVIGRLAEEDLRDIDDALIRHSTGRQQKVAMIVLKARDDLSSRFEGIPATYFGQRVMRLVEKGTLEGFGNLRSMRFSEVRRVSASDEL